MLVSCWILPSGCLKLDRAGRKELSNYEEQEQEAAKDEVGGSEDTENIAVPGLPVWGFCKAPSSRGGPGTFLMHSFLVFGAA